MTRRWLLPAVLALAGCGQVVVARFDASMFPPAPVAAVPRAAGAVVLRMQPEDVALRITGTPLQDMAASRVEVPIGEIVQAAAARAFAAEFREVRAAGSPGGGAPWSVDVAVAAIRFDYADDLAFFVPLGPLSFGRKDLSTRLSLEVRVLAPDGSARWSRSYDSGREIWRGPFGERASDGVQRQAHAQAQRLLVQAARDLRAWIGHERARERVL